MRIFFVATILVLMIFGCDVGSRNKLNITVEGCIIDSATKNAIPFAKVTVLCWYDAGWDKTDYVTIDTTTDKNGCFSTSFDEGYKIIIAAISDNYPPILKEYGQIKNKKIATEIALKSGVHQYKNLQEPNFTLRKFIVSNSEN